MASRLRPAKHHFGLLLTALAVVVAVAPLFGQTRGTQAAAGTRLYLSPASQSVSAGSNVAINVIIDPGGASINTVQSVLTYSSANFDLVSVAPSAAFGSFPNTASNGSLQFSAASSAPVTTVQTVATITLHADATGSSSINLASVCPAGVYDLTCSAVYDSITSDNDLSSVDGGSLSVVPPPAPPPTPSPTPAAPTKSTSHSSSHSTTNSQSTPAPTSTPAPIPTAAPTTSASPAKAPVSHVIIRILGTNKQPVRGAEVTAGQQSKLTDSSGLVSFQNLPPGRLVIVVNANNVTSHQVVDIKKGDPQQPQTITVKLAAAHHSILPYILILIGLGGGLLVAVAGSRLLLTIGHHDQHGPIPLGPPTVSGPTSFSILKPSAFTDKFLDERPDLIQPGTLVQPKQNDRGQ